MLGADIAVIVNFVVWGGLFGVTGISLLIYGWNLNRKSTSTPNWPAVKGKVLNIQVNRVSQSGGMGYSPVAFAPVIEYTYQVDGLTYQGNNLSSGPSAGTDSVTAQKIADRYSPGKAVTVRYNPSNPREAMVEVNPAKGNFYVMAGVIALFLAVIISCAILGFSVLVNGSLAS